MKCRIQLLGLPHFEFVVDHKPLVIILDRHRLDDIDNTRLRCLKEKTSLFSFTTRWTKGKGHCIPDALSRAPVSDQSRNDQEAEEVEHHIHAVTINSSRMVHEDDQEEQQKHLCDPILYRIRTVALYDENYKAIIDNVQNGFPFSRDTDEQDASCRHTHEMKNATTGSLVFYCNYVLVHKSDCKIALLKSGIEKA